MSHAQGPDIKALHRKHIVMLLVITGAAVLALGFGFLAGALH